MVMWLGQWFSLLIFRPLHSLHCWIDCNERCSRTRVRESVWRSSWWKAAGSSPYPTYVFLPYLVLRECAPPQTPWPPGDGSITTKQRRYRGQRFLKTTRHNMCYNAYKTWLACLPFFVRVHRSMLRVHDNEHNKISRTMLECLTLLWCIYLIE